MHDIALPVNEDVTVMPVLDLQEVSHHRIAGQAAHEIFPCRGRVGVHFAEKVSQSHLTPLYHMLIYLAQQGAHSGDVGKHLDDPAVRAQ